MKFPISTRKPGQVSGTKGSTVNQLATLEQSSNVVQMPAQGMPTAATAASLILDQRSMDSLVAVANLMASGKTTIPAHLRDNPGDCFAVCMQAMQWGMNPVAVAQKTHLVNGTLGYEAQLVNAVVSSSKLLATRINYRWDGDWSRCSGKNDKSPNLTVTVWATLKGETEPRSLTISMAQAGVRNSPNWEHDPKQQLAYLCTKRWARLHAPDVLLGVYTPDELEILPPAGAPLPRNAPPAAVAAAAMPVVEVTDKTRDQIARLEAVAAEQGSKAFKKNWNALNEEDRAAIGLEERDRLLQMGQRTDEQIAASQSHSETHEDGASHE